MKQNGGAYTASMRENHPHERALDNENKIIAWIYKWGYTTTKIAVFIVGGTHRTASLATLERQKKIARENVQNIAFVRHIYKLTDFGLMTAEAEREHNFEYPELTKKKVVTSELLKDLYTQALTTVAMKMGLCIDFTSPRMSGTDDAKDRQNPVVTWQDRKDRLRVIEVETRQRSDKKLDIFLGRVIENIESGIPFECLILRQQVYRHYTKALSRRRIPMWITKRGVFFATITMWMSALKRLMDESYCPVN